MVGTEKKYTQTLKSCMQRFNGAVIDVHSEIENKHEHDGFIYMLIQTCV